MHCPTDGTTLQLAERHGIEIDYCPDCRGIWLDRGELDKILDRADRDGVPKTVRREKYDDDSRHKYDDHRYKRKRGGFLGELFDFGD